jgi:predicted kinase
MREQAATVLAGGYSAILDATYMDARERWAAEDLARQSGVAFDGLWLDAEAALLAERIAARRGDASDATVAVLKSQLTADLGEIGWVRIAAGGADTVDRAAAALGLD